jgi:hypothetical protein
VQIAQARPPFVEFKQVPKHDPIKSEELGYRTTKNVNMAFIMQPGSRDQVEIEAEKWLDSIRRKALDGAPDAFPGEWVEQFKKKYEMWKEGVEAPLNGTSVKEWPVLSPAEVENFINMHILTIEDVANMTEEAMGRAGMGSRGLRDKAREWLQTKDLAGNALKENAELKQQLAEALERISALEADKPKRGKKDSK